MPRCIYHQLYSLFFFLFFFYYLYNVLLQCLITRLCTCMFLTTVSHPHLRDVIPLPPLLYDFLLLAFYWLSENECEATLRYRFWNDKKHTHRTDLRRNASCHCVPVFQVAWIEDIPNAFVSFHHVPLRFKCKWVVYWTLKDVLYCSVYCTKERQFAICKLFKCPSDACIYLPCHSFL